MTNRRPMAPVFLCPSHHPMGALSVTTGRRLFSPAPQGHRWLRWAKLGRRSQKNVLLSSMQSFFAYLAGKAIFRRRARANRRGILDAMNREHGYTLMETLVTLTLMMILSVGGLYGWQRWQQQQRLWQTAVQVRDFLLFLRDDANAYNRDRVLRVGQDEVGWCLSADGEGPDCASGTSFTLRPRWPGITLAGVTPGLGFYGLRSTAWAGNLRLQSAAGSWSIVISHWGRIRLCRSDSAGGCQ
ncbi:Prepilin peptidase dependent protein A precursor [Klebsiella pneumoniae subsp. pneumoniae 1084]|nr:Prepilin peptidase dependent protein A precursor [Klebsiella pneumoniae subsp. pneumoniae 1084]